MTKLFDRFTMFKNRYGEWEVTNEKEMVMTNRYTGEKHKCSVDIAFDLIRTIFPDKKEQRELLHEMLRD